MSANSNTERTICKFSHSAQWQIFAWLSSHKIICLQVLWGMCQNFCQFALWSNVWAASMIWLQSQIRDNVEIHQTQVVLCHTDVHTVFYFSLSIFKSLKLILFRQTLFSWWETWKMSASKIVFHSEKRIFKIMLCVTTNLVWTGNEAGFSWETCKIITLRIPSSHCCTQGSCVRRFETPLHFEWFLLCGWEFLKLSQQRTRQEAVRLCGWALFDSFFQDCLTSLKIYECKQDKAFLILHCARR